MYRALVAFDYQPDNSTTVVHINPGDVISGAELNPTRAAALIQLGAIEPI